MNIEKNDINNFVKNAVVTASTEVPGNQFMPSLMDKIRVIEEQKKHTVVAEPIISGKGWAVIGASIILIFTISFFFNTNSLSLFNYTLSFQNVISLYSSIPIPKVFLTGLFIFVFYYVLQIYFVVKKVDRSW